MTHNGRVKGNVMFQGFGVIERVERVTQYDEKNKRYFSNYVFDFAVLNMSKENEVFRWKWINDRRKSSFNNLLKEAPSSWKQWIKEGNPSLPKFKRNISSLLTIKTAHQKPKNGSQKAKALKAIYEYYDNKKHRFEGLAAVIAERVLNDGNVFYKSGWITPSSNDGGSDFVGRLDIGTGFSTAKLIVLGQAKCESLNTPTNGNHIARTVSRLKRGWIGVYITTSYYSEAVQKEIIDDKYPIVLIHGLKLTEEVLKLKHDRSFNTIDDLLDDIDSDYNNKIRSRRPEEVMYI